jgi:hypothetical protein
MMNSLRVVVVKMGGGYLKAILPDREESVFGRDEHELFGRLKSRGISQPLQFPARKSLPGRAA